MKHLNKLQTENLRKEIQQKGIKLPDLEEDILDFVCTAVEQELQTGSDFESARQKVFHSLRPNELQITQQTTEEMLNNRLSLLQKLAITVLGLTGVGFIMVILSLPYAKVLLILSVIALVIIYLYSSVRWYFKAGPLKNRSKLLLLFVVLSLIILFLALIFKIYRFPGANFMFIVSVIGLMFLPVYLSFLVFFRKKDSWVKYTFIEKQFHKAEWTLLSLLLLGFAARFLLISFLGNMLIITSLFGLSVLFLSYTWNFYIQKNRKGYRLLLFLFSLTAYLLFLAAGLFKTLGWSLVPAGLGNWPFLLVSLLAIFWYGRRVLVEKSGNSAAIFIASIIFSIYALLLLLNSSQNVTIAPYVYNVPVLILFSGLLVIFFRHPLFKALSMSLLAYYFLAFPYGLMPNRHAILKVYQSDPDFIELYQKSYHEPENDHYRRQLLEYQHRKEKQ